MYICPVCNKEFESEEKVVSHTLKCWKEKNPHRKSKEAPRGEDVIIRGINNEMLDFFNSFKGVC